jgi:predicted ATPase
VAHSISTVNPGINKHIPLDRLTSALQKQKTKKLDNKQGKVKDTEQRVQGALTHGEVGRGKDLNSM